MDFLKYHGLGNDFVLVPDFAGELLTAGPDLARQVCHRNFGIGADGLVLIVLRDNVYGMRIFNADGSEAEMCGNAIRCVADFLFERQLVAGTKVDIQTLGGLKRIERIGKQYAVDMGEPDFRPEAIPVVVDQAEPLEIEVEAGGRRWCLSAVSMGNPHGVIVVPSLADVPFYDLGPELESHSIFPHKANIEFVEVINARQVRLKVWERGVGPTLACGTGACATVAVTHRLGLTERCVQVELPGGRLQIEWRNDNHLIMTGPAQKVFAGTYFQ